MTNYHTPPQPPTEDEPSILEAALVLTYLAVLTFAPGQVCASHGAILDPDRCLAPDCPGGHGYRVVECDPRCPRHWRKIWVP